MLEGHRVVFNVLISPHICFYVFFYFLLHSYTSGIFLVSKMPEQYLWDFFSRNLHFLKNTKTVLNLMHHDTHAIIIYNFEM